MAQPDRSAIGPRRGGKTTLVRSAFADYGHLSMEDPDVLNKIAHDVLSLDVTQQAVVYDGEAEARTPRGDMVPYTRIGTLLGLDG